MYKEATNEIINWIKLYYDKFILVLVAVALVYLFFAEKKSRAKILYPIAFIFLCVLNPILYHYVLSKIIYWRVFWLLPETIIIAYAVTLFLSKIKYNSVKIIIFSVFVGVVMCMGSNMYKVTDFVNIQNEQKVSPEIKEICDVMLAMEENPTCIVPYELAWEVRVYSGDIETMYGRNAIGYTSIIDDWSWRVACEMASVNPDYEYIFGTAVIKKSKFVICEKSKMVSQDVLDRYDYTLVDEKSNYLIYYCADVEEKLADKWIITQYGPENGLSTCYTIVDDENNLIIIDGGYSWYEERLKAIIRQYDSHVAAWIITSQRNEHSGAFCAVMEDLDGITIDKIYTTEITDEQFAKYLETVQPSEDVEAVKKTIDITRSLDSVIYVKENDVFEALDLEFKVLHTWDSATDNVGSWHILNGSMCFVVTGNQEKFLFLSDLTQNMESHLIEEHGDELDADIVQMNNHGMWTFTGDTYDIISPHTAFFDCKESDLDPNAFSTAWHSYSYMKEKQVKAICLKTVPNAVILK